jgi:hypothetical protein
VTRRGHSSVNTLLGFSGAILGVVLVGHAWPEGFHALVVAIAESVVALLELPI